LLNFSQGVPQYYHGILWFPPKSAADAGKENPLLNE